MSKAPYIFKPSELRVGNVLEYETLEGEWIPTVIDWQDLRWLTENPEDFSANHRPIGITSESVLRIDSFEHRPLFSFFELNNFDFDLDLHVCLETGKPKVELSIETEHEYNTMPLPHITYIHQLQNLFYSLKGEELQYKIEP
jgi:hypothetical protein